jgi:uncharacterized protein YigE (DUF2233 family)
MHVVVFQIMSALSGALLAAAMIALPAQAQPSSKAGGDERPEAAGSNPCKVLMHDKATYIVCEFDLRRQVLRTYWKRSDGKPYRTIMGLVRGMKAEGRRPLFAMNAGMFKEDGSPLGLYVEDGKELVGPNTADGAGNFYLKPNGVLYIAGDHAAVVETARFVKEKPKADFATQSGPMLVIDGALHPKISPRGQSRHVRNGVGVRDGHAVVFAISKRAVTFGEFARLFKDRLGCPNALYLDGKVSGVYTTNTLPKRYVVPLGPMVAATARPR